jgi:hypothetical protein
MSVWPAEKQSRIAASIQTEPLTVVITDMVMAVNRPVDKLRVCVSFHPVYRQPLAITIAAGLRTSQYE